MTDRGPEDQLLEEALKRQRLLVDFYKQAAKEAPEKQCKELFKHLQSALQDQAGDVASELARHRMERSLGRLVADKEG